jgi:hypothetical protein
VTIELPKTETHHHGNQYDREQVESQHLDGKQHTHHDARNAN